MDVTIISSSLLYPLIPVAFHYLSNVNAGQLLLEVDNGGFSQNNTLFSRQATAVKPNEYHCMWYESYINVYMCDKIPQQHLSEIKNASTMVWV